MTTATKVFEQVKSSAEAIQSDSEQQFPEAATPGDYWRQGDLYITLLDELPSGLTETNERQLAPGTTQGSRHIVEGGATVYDQDSDALTGPVVEVTGRAVITHPEHGNVALPTGSYAITYQRAFADELRRVAD
ncbi:hypothetical protein CMI37_26435 [Candidatus Pacearchaeota archaeon]|nr:hypothetical protein [Candidatus Pacearchaeota archaeon]|tara:strand:+ start:546 stop:944 length:399 start_codon:yes stop_codon:yes gene_type:complete